MSRVFKVGQSDFRGCNKIGPGVWHSGILDNASICGSCCQFIDQFGNSWPGTIFN